MGTRTQCEQTSIRFQGDGPKGEGPQTNRGVGLKGPIPAREGPLEGGGEQMQGSHCEARALDTRNPAPAVGTKVPGSQRTFSFRAEHE